MIEVVALAGALAHARQHRVTAIGLGDIVDQLLHGDGLADAGTTKQSDLAALGIGAEQIDDLDAGDQHFRRARLFREGGGLAMDGGGVFLADGTSFVDRLADHIHDAAQGGRTDGHADGGTGVDHFLAAHQAFGGVHGDGAHRILAQMLGNLEHQTDFLAGPGIGVLGLQRVQDRGQFAILEGDVDDGADHLEEFAFGIGLGHDGFSFSNLGRSGSRLTPH